MKTAVLILAHKDPALLARLCSVLRHPDSSVFVHLDAKADINLYKAAGEAGAVFITNRVRVTWGGWSMVQAVLNSFREITAGDFDYLHLISGQDYPVKGTDEIHRELEAACGKNFVSYMPVDEGNPADRGLANRYRRYHIESRFRPYRITVKLLNRICFIRRNPPVSTIYKGSSWFTLTRDCVGYVLRFCEANPAYLKFFRRTANPDEMFFQNIILHSPLAPTAVNGIRRYIKWIEGRPSPEILRPVDYSDIVRSGAWFARKFDGRADILDLLDERRNSR